MSTRCLIATYKNKNDKIKDYTNIYYVSPDGQPDCMVYDIQQAVINNIPFKDIYEETSLDQFNNKDMPVLNWTSLIEWFYALYPDRLEVHRVYMDWKIEEFIYNNQFKGEALKEFQEEYLTLESVKNRPLHTLACIIPDIKSPIDKVVLNSRYFPNNYWDWAFHCKWGINDR